MFGLEGAACNTETEILLSSSFHRCPLLLWGDGSVHGFILGWQCLGAVTSPAT